MCDWSLGTHKSMHSIWSLNGCDSGGVDPSNFTSRSFEFDNRFTTIDERIAAIQGTLYGHTQWQATMGHEVASIR
jgi:hypothetical protein